MKPGRSLVLVIFSTIFCVFLIFRTELAHHLGFLTDADMGLHSQMTMNYTNYEQACNSWREAVRPLQYPPDPATYSDFRGIIEPSRLAADYLERQVTEAENRKVRAEIEHARLRKNAGWNFFKSWLANATDYTHSRWKCNRPDDSDQPVETSLCLFR